MPFAGFDHSDYDVFSLPGFAERMAAVRGQIRPKLVELAEETVAALRSDYGEALFAHVASHFRRRTNPPRDTWVAFGPSKRGYKAYPYLAIGLTLDGPYAEFVVMDESDHRATLAAAFQNDPEGAATAIRALEGMAVHLDHHGDDPGQPAGSIEAREITRIADELLNRKSSEFMIVQRWQRNDPAVTGPKLATAAASALERLAPIYRIALGDLHG